VSVGVLTRDSLFSSATLCRTIPFAVFIGLLASEPWLAQQLAGLIDTRWLYGLRSLIVGGLLVIFWSNYEELNAARRPARGQALLAVLVGLLVLAIWLMLDGGFFVLGQSGSGFDPRASDGTLDWPLALMRLAGSALLVPLMEELFWRSLVMRWLENQAFSTVDPRCVGYMALLFSSIVFGLEHTQWAAGTLAGLAFGWLYMRSGNLWVAVLAHAVTNAGLGVWVLVFGTWSFW